MKLGLLGAYIFLFLSVPPPPFFLFLPQLGYNSPVVWGHSLGRKIRIKTKVKVCSPYLPSLIQHPLLWWVGDTSCPGLFWLLSISLTLQQCIGAQPQAPVGLTPTLIRCHRMSPSPYSSQQYLPWCFFDVSSWDSYQTAPAKVSAQEGTLGRLWCHGCYTLFSHWLL